MTSDEFGRGLEPATFTVDARGALVLSSAALALLGYRPDEAEPTLALINRHLYPARPADLGGRDHGGRRWRQRRPPGCAWSTGAAGSVTVSCMLSPAHPRCAAPSWSSPARFGSTQERRTSDAVTAATVSRGVIEQAKGMIMVVLDVSADQAFDLLRWQSSNSNTKLRAVADQVVEALVDPVRRSNAPRAARGGSPRGRNVGGHLALNRFRMRPAAPARRRLTGEIPAADLPELLLRAVAGSAQSITIGDAALPEPPLSYVNDAFIALTGYPIAEILGRSCRFLQGADSDPGAVRMLGDAIRHGRPTRIVLRNYRLDGSRFWNEVDLSPVRDGTGRLTHVIGYQMDVTERVERENLLARLAYLDPATGLGNRAWVEQRATQGGDERPCCEVTVFGGHTADGRNLTDDEAILLAAERLSQVVPDGWLARPEARTLLVGSPVEPAAVLTAVRRALAGADGTLDVMVTRAADWPHC